VINLLENAARHHPAGSEITVTVRCDGGHVELVVSDRGPGIPASDLNTIFEPYRTGDLPGSNGLGLATCKAVVESHGGTITATNRHDGDGAIFTVRLPYG
jgi:signal transduction histidine kinase